MVSCTAYVWILIMQHCEEILLCVCWSEAGVPLSERTVGAWTVPMGWGVGTYTSTFEFIAWRCFAHVNDSLKLIVSQSVSQWNAWPATGRSAVQDVWSCAILQASLLLSPVSSSICCTHVRQGRPRWRFHSGLMSGLPPARLFTASRSVEWAGVASGSCCTWPKMESRLRQIWIAKLSLLVWLVTEAFVTKWNQQIPKICRWQFM